MNACSVTHCPVMHWHAVQSPCGPDQDKQLEDGWEESVFAKQTLMQY